MAAVTAATATATAVATPWKPHCIHDLDACIARTQDRIRAIRRSAIEFRIQYDDGPDARYYKIAGHAIYGNMTTPGITGDDKNYRFNKNITNDVFVD
jgi:hypothetical protein